MVIAGHVSGASQLKSLSFQISPIVDFPWGADFNHDHIVNQLDLNIVNAHWQQTRVGQMNGDANEDGNVDQLDVNKVNSHWQQTTVGRSAFASVPEPSAVCAAIVGVGAFAIRRVRRVRNIATLWNRSAARAAFVE